MTRGELIIHLTNQDCYPDAECDSEVSQLWHNAINGESCYIPFADELAVTTWCHILYELRIPPPLEYDAFYDVYVGWRETQYAEATRPANPGN